jgi:undecaprenyl-diphosphatase
MKSQVKSKQSHIKKRHLLRKQISILMFILCVSLGFSFFGTKIFFSLNSVVLRFPDQLLISLLAPLHTPQFDSYIVLATKLLSGLLVIFWGVISFILYRKKKKCWSFFVIASSALGSVMAIVLETIFDRSRPINLVLENHLFNAYPSAHVMAYTILVILLSYMIFHFSHYFWRSIIFFDLGIIAVLLVGLQRLMVNTHYFSDVIGGICFGISWSLLCIFFFRLYLLVSCNHS